MRSFLGIVLLGVLAIPARADIIDSGQAIIGGTMTVNGSAFSVGGSTFVVGAGSVTLGGRLNVAAAGIQWADGTTSTSAASSSGGGNFVMVGSSVLPDSGSGSVTFSGLTTSTTYRLEINLKQQSSGGYLQVRFNSDSSSAYKYSNNIVRQDGATAPTGSAGTTQCELENTPNPAPASGDAHFSSFQFSSKAGDVLEAHGSYTGYYSTGGESSFWYSNGMCRYSGSASLSSVTVMVSGGNATGTILLFRLQ